MRSSIWRHAGLSPNGVRADTHRTWKPDGYGTCFVFLRFPSPRRSSGTIAFAVRAESMAAAWTANGTAMTTEAVDAMHHGASVGHRSKQTRRRAQRTATYPKFKQYSKGHPTSNCGCGPHRPPTRPPPGAPIALKGGGGGAAEAPALQRSPSNNEYARERRVPLNRATLCQPRIRQL